MRSCGNLLVSAGDAAFRATSDQRRAAGGLVAIEGDRRAVDVVGGAAFDDGEHALAQRATDHVPDAGDGLAIDVGVAEGAEHLATVGGGIAEADDVFHGENSVSVRWRRCRWQSLTWRGRSEAIGHQSD